MRRIEEAKRPPFIIQRLLGVSQHSASVASSLGDGCLRRECSLSLSGGPVLRSPWEEQSVNPDVKFLIFLIINLVLSN
jgi:hypothetical protein